MKFRVCTFNNRGFPKMSRAKVKKGDEMVQFAIDPDLLMEQERWFAVQLVAFSNVFSKVLGYITYTPVASLLSGTVVARKWKRLRRVRAFTKFGHPKIPFVCNYRNFTGEVVRLIEMDGHKTLTYISAHPTPGAWGDRFPEGSYRKKLCQRMWTMYMNRLVDFLLSHFENGRDYAIVGMDGNARVDKIREVFGSRLAGKKVTILTSDTSHIDHLVIIGNFRIHDKGTLPGTPSDHDPFWADVEAI